MIDKSEFEGEYKMIQVKFYENIDDQLLKFAVVISKTNGK